MLIRNDCATFQILGQIIHLYSEDLGYGLNTVADMGDHFHYLGDEIPNAISAVLAFQDVNGRDLTDDEFHQVMVDNNYIDETELEDIEILL
jgi:hypothetical protein